MLRTFKGRLTKPGAGTVRLVPESYKGSDKKCDFIDEDYGVFSAYPYNITHHKQRHPDRRKVALEDVFVKTERRKGSVVRKNILKHKLLDYVCKTCGTLPTWCGKKLVLELHHIDGDGGNDDLNNLCFLCPNCHSQTYR